VQTNDSVLIRGLCGGSDVISTAVLSIQFPNSVTESNAACLYPLEISKCTPKLEKDENIKIFYGSFGIYGITEA